MSAFPVASHTITNQKMILSPLHTKMGLDASKFRQLVRSNADDDNDDAGGYTPRSRLPDSERFDGVDKFFVVCASCGESHEFQGVVDKKALAEKGVIRSGLCCPNPKCLSPRLWGEQEHYSCFARISNLLLLKVKNMVSKYYENELTCEDPTCGLVTKQLSVCGPRCLAKQCQGKLKPVFGECELWNTMMYHSCLFDLDHSVSEGEKESSELGDLFLKGGSFDKKTVVASISGDDRETLRLLKGVADGILEGNAYNFVRPSLFSMFFKQEGILQ